MADVSRMNPGSQGGATSRHSQGIKIDMTPLVDLAFLLLTFFILTRTFNDPHMMQVDMPDKPDTKVDVPTLSDKNVLNLVLAEHNKLYWWIGAYPQPKATNFSKSGVRKVLLDSYRTNPKIVVLIKPKANSKYENLVDVLDEIAITHLPRYFLMDYTNEDERVIESH